MVLWSIPLVQALFFCKFAVPVQLLFSLRCGPWYSLSSAEWPAIRSHRTALEESNFIEILWAILTDAAALLRCLPRNLIALDSTVV